MHNLDTAQPLDAIIIGGGPAGLQAALTFARVHRRVVVLDSGEYRNATVEHAHNLIGHDGAAPAALRARAREELAAYDTVELLAADARSVTRDGGLMSVDTSVGVFTSRAVVLATGIRDVLPEIPGLAELWGKEAAQCPFCHAHEFAGRPLVLLAEGPLVSKMTSLLGPVASTVTVIAPAAPQRIERHEGGVRIHMAEGLIDAAAVFLAPTPEQRSEIPAQLGLTMLPSGCVEVDVMGRTSVPGVYAAGDMAHMAARPGPLVSLASAIAAGQIAASSAIFDAIDAHAAS